MKTGYKVIMVLSNSNIRFFPSKGPSLVAETAGFRFGAIGTHTSRTIMFDELSVLLQSTKATDTRKEYAQTIIDMNCLAKPTASSRRLTNQRIGELYALDPVLPIFRIFRKLWDIGDDGRRLLAIQCAIARDPLLAATAQVVLSLSPNAEFMREPMVAAIRELVGERINENVLNKVVRNVASSWTQSGHLVGRTLKKRNYVKATPSNVAYALYLGYTAGFRGADLFTSLWMAMLDCNPIAGRQLAMEAKRIRLIDLRMAGEVIELNLDRLDPAYNRS
jgi:hypothetical protein